MAASCNQVFEIETTDPAAVVFDLDADSIEDSVDNCVELPNPDQLDGDMDGIGDACDLCPTKASEDQHDEDHDEVGDACDRCPGVRDFGDDVDSDGIGDLCERDSRPTSVRVFFDPFVTLRPEVVPGTVPWVAADDEIAPTRTFGPMDTGLGIPGAVLGNFWSIRTVTRSVKRWGPGEYVGIRVRATDSGLVVASCLLACDDTQNCHTSASTGNSTAANVVVASAVPEVQVSMFQSYDAVGGKVTYACIYFPLQTLKIEAPIVPPEGVTPELIGSPNVHFKHVDILQ